MKDEAKIVVIEYSECDGLKRVIADDNEMPDISAIQHKDMKEWFEESDGRDGWDGLIEEVKKFIEDENSKLIFKFKGLDEDKEKLRGIIGKYGYELQDASVNDLFNGNLKRAKKDELRGFHEKAFNELKEAVAGNSIEGRFQLAEFYYKKYDNKSKRKEINNNDLEEMLANYQIAADNGNVGAKGKLAFMYENGYFVHKDLEKAFKLYYELAEDGDSNAQIKIGDYYNNIKNDYYKAEKWYGKAADNQNIIAQDRWGNMFLEDGVFSNKSKDLSRKGLERVKNAAYGGYDTAQYNIGYFYEKGKNGLQKDILEAQKWYLKAAEKDNIYAQKALGDIYYFGKEGTEKNENKAQEWYLKAAEHGYRDAQKALGDLYYFGMGCIEKDEKEAWEWYLKAAKRGNIYAQEKIGDILLKKNNTTAYKWYERAAEGRKILEKNRCK